MENKDDKYPEGHFLGMWMGIGVAIFSGFGIPLSIATDNPGFIGMGPAFGVAFGLALGQSIEKKYKQKGKIRPLTVSEIKRNKIAVGVGVTILTLGVLIFILLLFI
jgi:hypothetical protein